MTTSAIASEPLAYRQPEGSAPREAQDAQRPLVLPPGIDNDKFQSFIEEIASVVARENVTVISHEAELYHDNYLDPGKAHDMFHIVDKTSLVSSAVIAPRNVPDVQSIMKIFDRINSQ